MKRKRPQPRRVARYCLATGALGVALLAGALASVKEPWAHPQIFVFFAASLAVFQAMPLRLSHERQSESLQLEEALFVPMAVFLTPVETLVALAGAVAFGQLWARRGVLKTAFNVGQLTVSASVGLTASYLMGTATGVTTPRSLAGAVVGGLCFTACSAVAVASVIAVAGQARFWRVLIDGGAVRMATWAGSLSLGILVVAATDGRPWMLLVVIVPIAVLQFAYGASLAQWRDRQRMEALYEAGGSIRSSMDSNTVRMRLVSAAQSLLQCEEAHLVHPKGPLPDGVLRVPVDDKLAIEVKGRVGGGAWSANEHSLLRALAGVAATALHNALLFEQIRAITSSLGEAVIALDSEGRVTFMNPAAEGILGWSRAELMGRGLHEAVHYQHSDGQPRPAHDCPLQKVWMSGRTIRDDDEFFTRKDGSIVPVAYTASPVFRDGQAVGAVLAIRDTTERKAFEQQLAHQAFHDALTDLPNRALFLDRLVHAHSRLSRGGRGLALLFIDLDRFKLVNDSLGHQEGDALLVSAARRFEACLRPADTFARFGGDEFTVLIEDVENPAEAVEVADRLLGALRRPFVLQNREIFVSASIGIAHANGEIASPDDLLSYADIAMYRAKNKGKACYEVYDSSTLDRGLERLELEAALRRALENDELVVYFQPIIALDSGRINGAEALVRWIDPVDGVVPPDRFISLAEETGLILPLGQQVLEKACTQARAWHARYPDERPLVVSVNLSARQFMQPDLPDQVAAVLTSSGLDPQYLCLEITESVVMEDTESTQAALQALKKLGVRLAIDDFGTGHSSLSYLKRLPVDEVKINRSFIIGLGENPVDTEIVSSVVRLGHVIGVEVVAEGVETPQQIEKLRTLGCPLVQGYYFARPQPGPAMEQMLDQSFAGNEPRPPATVSLIN